MSLKLTPNPHTVKFIREARRLSAADVASSSSVAVERLEEIEREPTPLSKAKVASLAKAMAVPAQFLFHERLVLEGNLPDFRTRGNKPAILTSAGLARVERARSILSYLNDAVFNDTEKSNIVGSVDISRGVEVAAEKLKRFYSPAINANGITDPQKTFINTRVNVEKSGAIVLCDRVKNDSFRGFCFSERDKFPLILINTSNQRPATKLFTLMHEVVHLMIGATGVSDPSILQNSVEQFCNRVTASVMMPDKQFSELYSGVRDRSVRGATDALSRYFGVSKQAAALRVSELGLSKTFYTSWLAALPPNVPPIEEEDEVEGNGGGGGIGAQISRFGYFLPAVLGGAVNKHSISIYDAYRLTNLKPATIAELARIGSDRLEH